MKRRFCRICEQPITVHDFVRGGLCGAPACRMAAERRRLAEEREAAEQARRALAARHVDALLEARPALRERIALVVIVGTDAPLVELPEQRKANLHAHLRRSLAAIEEPRDERHEEALPVHEVTLTQPVEAPPPSALAEACGLCRGHCCAEAGDEAFIQPATLIRARAAHPGLSGDELCALYMNALPARAVAGSCVFHGERGCTLPRTLRARICNEYYCEPLRRWIEPGGERLRAAAVVAVRDGEVRRSTVIEPEPA